MLSNTYRLSSNKILNLGQITKRRSQILQAKSLSSSNSPKMTNMYSGPKPSHTNGIKAKEIENEWAKPGPQAYDFFSDTITTPTLSMLEAITRCTLIDDVYTGDPTTQALEAHVANFAGHEAGLFVMSGTMGNQVSIRSHLTYPPHTVLCDYRAHIANYEAGGIATLSGAQLITVYPTNKHHLTLEDVKKHCIIDDDQHSAPTRVISLENTLNGLILPLDEVRRISAFARENDIRLHLDGARVWEAAAAGAGSLTEYCSLFDSVSMCLSKGLGAPVGSVIVGSKKFITQAKRIRKMMGGATRQVGILSAAGRVAVDEGFGKGPNGEGGKLRACHERAKRLGKIWEEKGGKLIWPVETNMVWLDVDDDAIDANELSRVAEEEGVHIRGSGRIVVHYQIAEEAIQGLERALVKFLDGREKQKRNGVAKST